MIIVGGRPGSGNKLIREHLRRSGIHAHVIHADSPAGKWPMDAEAVVVPIRLDNETRLKGRAHIPGTFESMLATLLRAKTPVYFVAYEEMQRTGGEALNDIIRSIGHEPAPWPDAHVRANPHEGRVLSEEERAAQHTRQPR